MLVDKQMLADRRAAIEKRKDEIAKHFALEHRGDIRLLLEDLITTGMVAFLRHQGKVIPIFVASVQIKTIDGKIEYTQLIKGQAPLYLSNLPTFYYGGVLGATDDQMLWWLGGATGIPFVK